MLCGVKFCGGCNPRFRRSDVLDKVKQHFTGRVEFEYVKEGRVYDLLLIIGGCPNCCASYEQYEIRYFFIKIWDETQIDDIIQKLEGFLENSQGGKTFELERGL